MDTQPTPDENEGQSKFKKALGCIKTFAFNFSRKLKDPRFFVEVAALIGLIVYARITFMEWRDANKNFRSDERPWVTLETALGDDLPSTPDGKNMILSLATGQEVLIPVYLRNSGKTPATNIESEIAVQIADRKEAN